MTVSLTPTCSHFGCCLAKSNGVRPMWELLSCLTSSKKSKVIYAHFLSENYIVQGAMENFCTLIMALLRFPFFLLMEVVFLVSIINAVHHVHPVIHRIDYFN